MHVDKIDMDEVLIMPSELIQTHEEIERAKVSYAEETVQLNLVN
jgi:hypothetical protein